MDADEYIKTVQEYWEKILEGFSGTTLYTYKEGMKIQCILTEKDGFEWKIYYPENHIYSKYRVCISMPVLENYYYHIGWLVKFIESFLLLIHYQNQGATISIEGGVPRRLENNKILKELSESLEIIHKNGG